MLFSEPKIPQFAFLYFYGGTPVVSVLFSEPKIPQLASGGGEEHLRQPFQCSSASRKFLNPLITRTSVSTRPVSVLFSEPKIPQYGEKIAQPHDKIRFSALQRAENSSIRRPARIVKRSLGFSALQRAENSSMNERVTVFSIYISFQCSSASRKFLNSYCIISSRVRYEFQCSSASRKFLNPSPSPLILEVLAVSVLFSEPKIPQFSAASSARACVSGFSALQRAENSSISSPSADAHCTQSFQCSSASRKFLNQQHSEPVRRDRSVSVLFSEPKIPQCFAHLIRAPSV